MAMNRDVWYCIPSARPDGGTVKLWLEAGYQVAVQRDYGAPELEWPEEWDALRAFIRPYLGYAEAVNFLAQLVLAEHPLTKIIIIGGDDIEPPRQDPAQLVKEFQERFPDLYGVMQPTGDRWQMKGCPKPNSELVCGSPWLGASWCRYAYQGHGPLNGDYYHYFVDEELQLVAQQQNVFWQRPDIVQKHNHYLRLGQTRPGHLKKVDDRSLWLKARKLFDSRKSAGFPGSERLKP